MPRPAAPYRAVATNKSNNTAARIQVDPNTLAARIGAVR